MESDIPRSTKEYVAKSMVKQLYEGLGYIGLAEILQGTFGPCPICERKKPPHKNDCEFAKEAKKMLASFVKEE